MDNVKEFAISEMQKYMKNNYVPGTWRDNIFSDKIKQAAKEKFGLDEKTTNELGFYIYNKFKFYAIEYGYVADRLNFFGDL